MSGNVTLIRLPGAQSIPELITRLSRLCFDIRFGILVPEEGVEEEIRRIILDALEGHDVDVTEWRSP